MMIDIKFQHVSIKNGTVSEREKNTAESGANGGQSRLEKNATKMHINRDRYCVRLFFRLMLIYKTLDYIAEQSRVLYCVIFYIIQ